MNFELTTKVIDDYVHTGSQPSNITDKEKQT